MGQKYEIDLADVGLDPDFCTELCDGCPLAVQDDYSKSSGVHAITISDITGETRITATDIDARLVNHGRYFPTYQDENSIKVGGPNHPHKVEKAIDSCQGPYVEKSRLILPDKISCGALQSLVRENKYGV